MNEIQTALAKFEKNVPHGEEAFMVLKAHLLAEYSLLRYVNARIPDNTLMAEIENEKSPVASGLGLILLAQALSLRDDISPTCSDVLWPALKRLNTLRNKLAHQLHPNHDSIVNHMQEFVRHISGAPCKNGENLNLAFYRCAQALIGYLAIDQVPLTENDLS